MFVIRSMSTGDWNGRDPVVPYHVYLMKPEHRAGAYWTSFGRQIMVFATMEEAEAEWLRLFPEGRPGNVWPHHGDGRTDIAPLGHPVPVWEALYHRPEVAAA